MHTHSGVGTLRGLAHHLHDEVSLRLKQRAGLSDLLTPPPAPPPAPPTSLSKLALVNSSELRSALVAASFTLLLGSSFLMPWMMAVRIWFPFSCSCSGS